jgi:2-alkyl-3-oxoalkanoate reductase
MTYVDSLVAAVVAGLERPTVRGPVNVADATPVVPAELITELFDRLYRPIRILPVPIAAARALAAVVERTWRIARIPAEPPLTRYAVAAFAEPVLLDLARLHGDLQVAPDADLDIGVARTAAWLQASGTP